MVRAHFRRQHPARTPVAPRFGHRAGACRRSHSRHSMAFRPAPVRERCPPSFDERRGGRLHRAVCVRLRGQHPARTPVAPRFGHRASACRHGHFRHSIAFRPAPARERCPPCFDERCGRRRHRAVYRELCRQHPARTPVAPRFGRRAGACRCGHCGHSHSSHSTAFRPASAPERRLFHRLWWGPPAAMRGRVRKQAAAAPTTCVKMTA
jgi:hypothetical protein